LNLIFKGWKNDLLYMMCVPWKKMKKDEKLDYIRHKIMKGVAVFLFGAIWMYFTSSYMDVWNALPPTLAVMGLLCILYGLWKKSTI